MKPSEIAFKAADLIDERGWTRGAYERDNGCLCADGALQVAAFGTIGGARPTDIEWDAYMAAYMAAGEGVQGIINYNDETAKDKRYVTRKLRAAGRALEAEGQ